jgi:hypothetical protein
MSGGEDQTPPTSRTTNAAQLLAARSVSCPSQLRQRHEEQRSQRKQGHRIDQQQLAQRTASPVAAVDQQCDECSHHRHHRLEHEMAAASRRRTGPRAEKAQRTSPAAR